MARLTSLSHLANGSFPVLLGSKEPSNIVVIEFPTPPESINLARRTYYEVTSAPNMPDGFHQYDHTEPLEIPISFSLHHQSDLAPKGAVTLLELAAKLHSLTLPIGDQNFVRPPTTKAPPPPDSSGHESKAEKAGKPDTQANLKTWKELFQSFPGWPVVCLLDLIYTGDNSPGIRCIGYVKDADVKLHKPILKGPNGEYGLPVWAEYSFTFVHHPSYSNTGTGLLTGHSQAFADDVKKNLYNSMNLTMSTNLLVQGFRE